MKHRYDINDIAMFWNIVTGQQDPLTLQVIQDGLTIKAMKPLIHLILHQFLENLDGNMWNCRQFIWKPLGYSNDIPMILRTSLGYREKPT